MLLLCTDYFVVMRRTLFSHVEITLLLCIDHFFVMQRALSTMQLLLLCHTENILLPSRVHRLSCREQKTFCCQFVVIRRTLLSCRDHFLVNQRICCYLQRSLCCNDENTFVLQRSLHCHAENILLPCREYFFVMLLPWREYFLVMLRMSCREYFLVVLRTCRESSLSWG